MMLSTTHSVPSYEIMTVNNELGRMWKKAAVPGMRHSPVGRAEVNHVISLSENLVSGPSF
jgi:hypothetical protein